MAGNSEGASLDIYKIVHNRKKGMRDHELSSPLVVP